jgi:hypothetical protein
MKRALLVLLLAGGCGGEAYEPGPDVRGAWADVFGRSDLSPSFFRAAGPEMEHRQGMDTALVRDLSAEELAHALTHVWMIRAVRERPDSEEWSAPWMGDPEHVQSVWISGGQPAALEKTALEYLRAH